jgi:uncharacterized repeat protein (TIGR03837 family)
VVSLFCYDSAPVAQLLDHLAAAPTLLLATPGSAQRALRAWEASHGAAAKLRSIDLPWFTQADFDRLLWACDLNFVRGEDSFVRAMWAGAAFVWQIYPQHDAAHAGKLEAFLERFLDGAAPGLRAGVRATWQAWNGLATWPDAMAPLAPWEQQARRWRHGLLAQPDLATQLLGFVSERR